MKRDSDLSDEPKTTQPEDGTDAATAGENAPAPEESRALTPKARWRSWTEVRVRFWWLMALVFMAVAAVTVTDETLAARRAAWRLTHWERVQANILQLGATRRPTAYGMPGEDHEVTLVYTDHGGRQHESVGHLIAQEKPYHPQMMVPILIDPNDPQQWTDRIELKPLVYELLGGLTLIPIGLVLMVVALVQRSATRRLWRSGVSEEAVVVESRHTAAAPFSRIVRCTLRNRRDRTVLTVYVPTRYRTFSPGDSLRVIVPSSARNTPALVADLYDGA